MAESLTGGLLTSCLAAATGASDWLRGGLVAYDAQVKREVLRVRPGPVVSEDAAADMAVGIRRLLHASLGIAVTGVGGPEPQDGQPAGTVWIAVAYGDDGTTTRLLHLDGTPDEVCEQTCEAGLRLAGDALGATVP